jgi:flagellar biogenesis protein FliO
MAKHFLIRAAACWFIAGPTICWAAPATEGTVEPVMLKKIFTESDEKSKSHTSPQDVLELGISKRNAAHEEKSKSPLMAVATSAAALIFVVGLFLFIAWLVKRGASRGNRALPPEVFDILGRASLGAQQVVQLVRVGNKLLLVASSAEGARTLTEIDSATEVERLSGLCMTNKETSATREFRETLDELASGAGGMRHAGRERHTALELSTSQNDSLALSDLSLLAPTR